MENSALAIGTMKTSCQLVAWPEAVAPMQARMERALGGAFRERLGKSLEPVLEGQGGVIRIRHLTLDLTVSGEWDEQALAALIASKIATTVAGLLESSPSSVRIWPDHDAYMASFVDYKLGLVHEPEWAFPEFEPLRLLSAEQAAAEVLKSRPSVLSALAANGSRAGNPRRVAARLGSASAAAIVTAWLATAAFADRSLPADMMGDWLAGAARLSNAVAEPDVYRQIIALMLELSLQQGKPDRTFLVIFAVTLVAVTKLSGDSVFQAKRTGPLSVCIASLPASAIFLPEAITAFLKRLAGQSMGSQLLDRIEEAVLKAKSPSQTSLAKLSPTNKAGKPAIRIVFSPFAGFALLLPDIVRLAMFRQLGQSGLRETVMSMGGAQMRERLEADEFLLALFAPDEEGERPVYPPVPAAALATLAPESRQLLTGLDGAEGWGNVLIASFASRLPGLRASSRGYLMRQFLNIGGTAEISKDSLVVKLEGPPLAVVLTMAGLSGDQMPLPFFGNRLLVLKLGGGR